MDNIYIVGFIGSLISYFGYFGISFCVADQQKVFIFDGNILFNTAYNLNYIHEYYI